MDGILRYALVAVRNGIFYLTLQRWNQKSWRHQAANFFSR
jgi:hypothetical protein